MRIADFAFLFTTLSPNLRLAAAKAFTSSILSTTSSEVFIAVENIPIPHDAIADPNKILDQTMKQNLTAKLNEYSSSLTVNPQGGRVVVTSRRNRSCNKAKKKNNRNEDIYGDEFPVQIAIAIVEGMDIANSDECNENDVEIEELAGQFAMSLHNAWGIGHEILPFGMEDSTENDSSGGTGVLIFLSVRDRVVFISVGGALDHLLTSGRIDRIINDNMREDLKRANYGLGLTKGIDAIVEILEKNEEPSVIEKITENWDCTIVVFLWIFFPFGIAFFRERKKQREERIYAKVAAQLSELDRAKAEALRGSYQRTTSCPICLENFSSIVHGSDGRPIQLLRCGHVFDKTCYEKWISSGNGDVTKCPVCRADIGIGCDNPPNMDNPSRSEGAHDPSDGSSSNNGDQQNVDRDHNPATFAIEDDSDNESCVPTEIYVRRHETQINGNYRVDRNFRLERLSELYPSYITPDAMTRWCSPTFNGPLANDPYFRSRNPVVCQNENRCCSSGVSNNSDDFSESNHYGGGYNYGGGTSAGGAGGRF